MASKNTERAVVPLGKGIHRNPSVGSDGELSECVNLLPNGEEMTGMPFFFQAEDGIRESNSPCFYI